MNGVEAAALWIGLHAILLVYISAQVGRARLKHKVNLGDGGNDEVTRAIRAQGNYIEYAPAALLGLWILASMGITPMAVHILGGVFFFGRVAHYLGLGAGVWPMGRSVGTALTMLTLLVTGGWLIYCAVT